MYLSRIPRRPRSTLSPYTTLFRSPVMLRHPSIVEADRLGRVFAAKAQEYSTAGVAHGKRPATAGRKRHMAAWGRLKRSEEHTSELQSRLHLVCRLLLEKKR